MEKKKKKQTWTKRRHRIVQAIARVLLTPYVKLKYRIQIDRFAQEEDRPYLVLMNHTTAFDQFFVGISFRRPLYYMATEDIFSLGWISKLLRWAVAPIPIRKQTTDITAVMNCIKVVREGGSIVIAPEGNRTYSGRTGFMNGAIAPLIKKLKLPLALYRIEGGYGAQPRWSDGVRRGKMHSYVARVIQPEEYAAMSNEELLEQVKAGLYVDEAMADVHFYSGKRAEYLERAMYVCPFCGLSEFESNGTVTECKKCHRKIHYNTDKTLTGEGFEFPHRFLNDWYEYQQDFINQLDLSAYTETPLYRDQADVSEVIVYKHKNLLRKDASIALYGDRIVFDEGTENQMDLPFSQTDAVTVLGRNKLNIYFGKDIFQLKGSKRFNALKYVNIFFRYQHIQRGEENGKFLGL